MMVLMTKRFEPWIIQQESTPDGFAEVTLEINGRILATQVGYNGMGEQWSVVHHNFMGRLKALC